MKFVVLLLSLTLIGCQSAKNQIGDSSFDEYGISFDVKKKIYPNGLTVLVVENHKLPIFSYYTYYKVGSKYEVDGITGSSHYLEHMMFKGAKKYGAGEFDNIVEGNGGSNNAYTTGDLTVYYENLPSEHFEKIADLEADRMENLLLEKNAFEQERKVVLEERKMRYENSDGGKLFLSMMKEVFKGTAYGTSVIGKIKDIKSVTRKQMYDYFKTFYAPNNAVIVLVGDLDAEKVFDVIDNKFGSIPVSNDLEILKKQRLAARGFKKISKKFGGSIALKGSSPTPVFKLAFKGVKVGSKDSYPLDILSSIIGGGQSSYLDQYYVSNKKPLLSGISASNYTIQEDGVFFISGRLLPTTNLKKIKKSLYQNLKKTCDNAITDRSVQKIKNQYMVSLFSGLDTNAGVASFLGDREVYMGSYDFYKKETQIYNAITKSELKSVCKKYLVKNQSIFLSIWNKH